MINNRQAGRRNRGRNNGRQNGGNRGGDNGNRIDNRARGNAPQLLEKYRNMARDAQLAGDRVNTEYYLQFADHYFRVIADNRARHEEQQARFRRNDDNFDDDYDAPEGGNENAYDRMNDAPVMDRNRNPVRFADDGETDAAPVDGNRFEESASESPEDQGAPRRAPRGRKPRQPVKVEVPVRNEDQHGLDLAALPPAIARADNDSEGEAAPEPAPRRRGRPRRAAAEAAE